MRKFTIYPKQYVSATTKRELDARKKGVREARFAELRESGFSDDEIRNTGFGGWGKARLSDERENYYELQREELSAIDMLHSILAYEPGHTVDSLLRNRYMQSYIKKLGKDRVAELCQMELDEFANAQINKDIFVDDEGLSYNSVTFRDDVE